MNKSAIVKKASRLTHKVLFQLNRHLPEILIGAGATLGVCATVKACKATVSIQPVLEEHKEAIALLKEDSSEQFNKAARKEIAHIYGKTAVECAKEYLPAAVIGTAAIGCMFGSHTIIRRRNLALAAAYTTIDKAFKTYRGRAVERFGKEVDKELLYGIATQKVIDAITDDNGETKQVETEDKTVESISPIGYSRYITKRDSVWDDNPLIMNAFFNAQQNFLNDLLVRQGYLFLNQAYDALELKTNKAGQQVGWLYQEINPQGDNFVQFMIERVKVPVSSDPEDGYEDAYLVDFNVDGNILDKLDDDDYV